jgi:DNA topoisomerase IB
VRGLAIPPAWTDVWICPHPRGHLQAVGTDDAGRRQYLYHPQWRLQRDLEKFERVASYAPHLPAMRRRLRVQMRSIDTGPDAERQRILSVAVRLLDLGCFRPGSDSAADEGSHGLTTLERQHVRRDGDAIRFRFVGKAGVEHEIRIEDPDVVHALAAATPRRSRTARVLESKIDNRWRPLTAEEVNAHIATMTGTDMTAKDFRTWHATAEAAVALAQPPRPASVRQRRERIRAAYVAASDLLGNTPAMARSAYVDPRVIDLFESGVVLEHAPRSENDRDRAVAELLARA